MKKQTTLAGTRKVFYSLSLLLALFIGSNSAFTQDSVNSTGEPRLRYLGIVKERAVFELSYRSDNKPFRFEIVDESGYELYQERSATPVFTKKFAINKSDLENNAISVVVNYGEQTRKFRISRSYKTIEQISVVELE